MEGSFAATYGTDLKGIWLMSWRRFNVLLNHLFAMGALSRPEQDNSDAPTTDPVTGSERFDAVTDWNKLVGKEPPDRSSSVSFNDFMSRSGIQRKVV